MSVSPKRCQRCLQQFVAGDVVGHQVTQIEAFRRRIFDVPHVEIKPAAVEKKPAVAGRFFVVAIMEIDRARRRPCERDNSSPSPAKCPS